MKHAWISLILTGFLLGCAVDSHVRVGISYPMVSGSHAPLSILDRYPAGTYMVWSDHSAVTKALVELLRQNKIRVVEPAVAESTFTQHAMSPLMENQEREAVLLKIGANSGAHAVLVAH